MEPWWNDTVKGKQKY